MSDHQIQNRLNPQLYRARNNAIDVMPIYRMLKIGDMIELEPNSRDSRGSLSNSGGPLQKDTRSFASAISSWLKVDRSETKFPRSS